MSGWPQRRSPARAEVSQGLDRQRSRAGVWDFARAGIDFDHHAPYISVLGGERRIWDVDIIEFLGPDGVLIGSSGDTCRRAVGPGGVDEGHALRRCATARDVANAVVFLASGRANCLSGEVLHVDGGYHL